MKVVRRAADGSMALGLLGLVSSSGSGAIHIVGLCLLVIGGTGELFFTAANVVGFIAGRD